MAMARSCGATGVVLSKVFGLPVVLLLTIFLIINMFYLLEISIWAQLHGVMHVLTIFYLLPIQMPSYCYLNSLAKTTCIRLIDVVNENNRLLDLILVPEDINYEICDPMHNQQPCVASNKHY